MQRPHYSLCRKLPRMLTGRQFPYLSPQFPIQNQSAKSKHIPQIRHIRCPDPGPPLAPQGQQHPKRVDPKGFSRFHSWSLGDQIVFPTLQETEPGLKSRSIVPWLQPSLRQAISLGVYCTSILSPYLDIFFFLWVSMDNPLNILGTQADMLQMLDMVREQRPRNCFWTTSARHVAEKHLERENMIHWLFWGTNGLCHPSSRLWGQLRTASWEDTEQGWLACILGFPGIREAGDQKESGGTAFGAILKRSKTPNSPSQVLKILQ